MNEMKNIPVTIITGFLGAGKTTFLNKLISENKQTRFAIIENEFGDISIDQELVVNSKEGIFEMSNGCICCSLNVELGELLKKLISGPYQFDHLLIETTGIAEPDGIASAFLGPGKEATFHLDGTICLADAESIIKNITERGEAVKQIAFSDLIVLNKTDLVTSEILDAAKEEIRKYNADSQIIESTFGSVYNSDVLNLKAYDSQKIEYTLARPHPHHHHNELIAHSFEFDEPLDSLKFEHWVNMLLFLSGYQIFRIKGILHIKEEDNKVIFQSVRSRSKIEYGNSWESGKPRLSKIVFIGYNIKKEPLEKGLKGCVVK